MIAEPATSRPLSSGEVALALAWGFAEATVFFLVPDVLLTRIAVRSGGRAALVGGLWALAGSIGGGICVYSLARAGQDQVLANFFAHLPGISSGLVADAKEGLLRDGSVTLFHGAYTGIPFKLYSLHAGHLRLDPWSFFGLAVVARLTRFVLTSLVAAFIGAQFLRRWSMQAKMILHLVFWAAFYAIFFGLRS